MSKSNDRFQSGREDIVILSAYKFLGDNFPAFYFPSVILMSIMTCSVKVASRSKRKMAATTIVHVSHIDVLIANASTLKHSNMYTVYWYTKLIDLEGVLPEIHET